MDALARPPRQSGCDRPVVRRRQGHRVRPRRTGGPPSLSLCLRVSYHPTTRAHVRLLGPCFKTGREGGRRDHGPRALRRRDDARRPATRGHRERYPRLARPAGRRRTPHPPQGARAASLPRSAAGPDSHARCNTPAVAGATFARRFWPTSNRSWPAPDARALGRCAC